MRCIVVIVLACLVLLTITVSSFERPPAVTAQIDPDRINLVVEDLVDWEVLYESLSSTDVSDEFDDHLLAGRSCRHLGQECTYESGNERDYDVQAAFRASSGTRYVLDWTYDKSSSSGTSPAVPPDTVGSISETTPTSGPNHVLLSTQLTFEFLLEVLGNPPSMVSSQLSTKTLVDLWTEVEGSTYYVFLRFEDSNENLTTKRVWATYSNGEFGSLSND